MKNPLIFFGLLAALSLHAAIISGTDTLQRPALWPPDTYESLCVTIDFEISQELSLEHPRAAYCDLILPNGRVLGTYTAQLGTPTAHAAEFLFDGGILRSYDEEGTYTLRNFRLLTDNGFAPLEGEYTTAAYPLDLFPPICQSTLLSHQNGVEVALNADRTAATLSFFCPENSAVLPSFFYRDDCEFDGFAVAIDSRLDGYAFPDSQRGLFSTRTYTALDVSSQLFRQLTESGNRDGQFNPGETLQVTFPIQASTSAASAETAQENLYLLLFYHCVSDRQEATGAVVLHPLDENQDLHLSREELDKGRDRWNDGEFTPGFLLEAIELCEALTYEYDYVTERFYPVN